MVFHRLQRGPDVVALTAMERRRNDRQAARAGKEVRWSAREGRRGRLNQRVRFHALCSWPVQEPDARVTFPCRRPRRTRVRGIRILVIEEDGFLCDAVE